MPQPFEAVWAADQVEAVLRQVRDYPWPPAPDVPDGWSYGCDGAYLKALCEHWTERYDWRAALADLNRFPQFTARVEDYDLHFVEVHAKQEKKFQYPDEELRKLLDPKVKAFFVVNPGNPFAVAMDEDTIAKIGAILKKRPDLILLTDDVYGTFVPGFRSLMGAFPKNTIGVYSYSKYFGCTGWRLGTVAVHEDNIFDDMIAKHPESIRKKLDKRYGGLTLEPRKLAFIDRIVADSRDVALNHTAGLSLPQQVMMSLFSLYELMDDKKAYQKACIGICKKRVQATIERDQKFGTDIYSSIRADFDGFELSFYLSTQMAARQSMVFHGDEGFIQVASPFNAGLYDDHRVELFNQNHTQAQVFRFPGTQQYRLEVETFARAASGGEDSVFTLEESILNQKMIDAIFRAGEKDGWERV